MSRIARVFFSTLVLAGALYGASALTSTRAANNKCQAHCNRERAQCFVTCERPNAPANCLIACDDVYQICLSQCAGA